ncbi:Centrosomal protein of 83 kDa, partial [Quaeritorhiza haematococci]
MLCMPSTESLSDTERLRTLQRENSELSTKTQGLLSELEEIRAEKEALSIKYEQQERLYQRKILEETAHAKDVQAENDSMKTQIQTLKNELRQHTTAHDQLSSENSMLLKELEKSKSKLEEVVHQFNVETSDYKASVLKEKNQYENTINDLKKKVLEHKSSLKSSAELINDLRVKLSNAEKDYLAKLRAAREEEWAKIAQLESDKSDLEKKVSTNQYSQKESVTREEAIKKELTM